MNVTRGEGNRRLLVLAKFLREVVPDEHFNYATWTDGFRPIMGKPTTVELVLHTCGTTACALGWACIMPEFNALGLHLSKMGTPAVEISGEVYRYEDAGDVFFGLTHAVTAHLFMGVDEDGEREDERPLSSYTREEVAQRIEDWVSNNPA